MLRAPRQLLLHRSRPSQPQHKAPLPLRVRPKLRPQLALAATDAPAHRPPLPVPQGRPKLTPAAVPVVMSTLPRVHPSSEPSSNSRRRFRLLLPQEMVDAFAPHRWCARSPKTTMSTCVSSPAPASADASP